MHERGTVERTGKLGSFTRYSMGDKFFHTHQETSFKDGSIRSSYNLTEATKLRDLLNVWIKDQERVV